MIERLDTVHPDVGLEEVDQIDLGLNFTQGFLNIRILFLPLSLLVQERLIIAVMALASCEFMFEETRNYVMQRKAFGRTIADLQVPLNSCH